MDSVFTGSINIGCQTFKIPVEHQKKAKTNHVWLVDVSGSMCYHLPKVKDDIIEKIKTLPEGDSITLGWFSGRNQHKIFLTGYPIRTDTTEGLEKVVNNEFKTKGWTCFSEILNESNKTIDTLQILSNDSNFEFMFFTDGYPTVDPYEAEVKAIMDSLRILRSKVSSSLLIGYGEYFNRELMGEMSQTIGGSLICSKGLSDFSSSLGKYLEDVSGIGRKISFSHGFSDVEFAFTVSGSTVIALEVKDGEVSVPAQGEEATVYFVIKKELNHALPIKAVYGAALIHSQRNEIQASMKLLSKIGDVAILNKLSSAFTNEEYADTEATIRDAVSDESKRFAGGRKENCLPKDDAFCLLDAIETILEDKTARFYPMNSYFKYKRVGAPSKPHEDVKTEFRADPDAACYFSGLVWNSSKLNLSVHTVINGTVKLPEGHAKLGLADNFPCFVHRTYTLVSDGKPNITILPMRFSEATHKVLHENGMVDAEWKGDDNTYLVELTKVPVINFKIANGQYKASELCALTLEDLKLGGKLKALKYYKKVLEDDLSKNLVEEKLTRSEEIAKFLEENHINDEGAYNPPMVAGEATDVLHVNTFEIKIKGLSSLPSVNAVKLTLAESLVAEGIAMYETTRSQDKSIDTAISELDVFINNILLAQKTIRKAVQRTKFALILGKKWFSDIPTRGNEIPVVLMDGNSAITATISLGKEEIKI